MLAEPVRKPDISPDDESKKPALFDYTSDDLPSGRKATVIAYGGEAEDAFLRKMQSKNAIIQAEAIDEILYRCIKNLDGKKPSEQEVLDLHEADRRAILLRARWRTFPDSQRIEFKWRCAPPHIADSIACGHEDNHHVFDLAKVTAEPIVQPAPVQLPVSKKTATFEPPTGNTAVYYLKKRKGSDAVDRTQLFLARGVAIDGERATEAQLRALIGGDRSVIAKALRSTGGPNTRVEVPCSKCNALWKTLAEGLPGFFFPKETDE